MVRIQEVGRRHSEHVANALTMDITEMVLPLIFFQDKMSKITLGFTLKKRFIEIYGR